MINYWKQIPSFDIRNDMISVSYNRYKFIALEKIKTMYIIFIFAFIINMNFFDDFLRSFINLSERLEEL